MIYSIKVKDLGVDKYYESAARVARAVQAAGGGGGKGDAHTRGMLFCGTGIGVGIIANKFTGERTRVFWQVHHAIARTTITLLMFLCKVWPLLPLRRFSLKRF